MKKSILLFTSILAISAITAQQTSMVAMNTLTPKDHYSIKRTIKKDKPIVLNATYLKEVNTENTSAIVKELELQAAEFDIRNSEVFDNSEKATYHVVFKKEHGELIANYNNNGEILSSIEKYKNVVIPLKTRIQLSIKYPSWSFDSNIYQIVYNASGNLNTSFKIRMKKGNDKKTITIKNNLVH